MKNLMIFIQILFQCSVFNLNGFKNKISLEWDKGLKILDISFVLTINVIPSEFLLE